MLNLAFFPQTYRPNITFKNKIAQLSLSVAEDWGHFFLNKEKQVQYKSK